MDIDALLRPEEFVGRAAEQVDEFLAAEVEPVLRRYSHLLGQRGELKV